jgi:F-type H+-transporting ATPase subunit delta
MINKKVARRYTLALFEIAEEQKQIEKAKKDFQLIKDTIESSRELKIFLKTPIINSQKKKQTLEDIFAKKVSEITIKFLGILTAKGRENFLYDIASDFLSLSNEKSGIVEANIRTAVELNDKERKNLENKLAEYTGKKIAATFTLDKTIKGGFVAQVADTIIDASIKRQLELLYEQFKKGNFSN